MSKKQDHISTKIKNFMELQPLFFVATAACDGRINLSPKGMDSLRVLSKQKVVWLNYTGSGNETAAHLLKNNRMTIMFCSFDKKPLILRLYGHATIYHPNDDVYQQHIDLFPNQAGARQIIDLDVDLVQQSCGFAVPYMEYKGERNQLTEWAEQKGEEGIKNYWNSKNKSSIDGFETGI